MNQNAQTIARAELVEDRSDATGPITVATERLHSELAMLEDVVDSLTHELVRVLSFDDPQSDGMAMSDDDRPEPRRVSEQAADLVRMADRTAIIRERLQSVRRRLEL